VPLLSICRTLICFLAFAIAPFAFEAEQADAHEPIMVPEKVATLLRPILDLEATSSRLCRSTKPQSCTEGREREDELARSREIEKLTTALLSQKGQTANEALAVLLCYYIGEGNGEDVLFTITSRGRQMLSPLHKYEHRMPVISDRTYPDRLLLSTETKITIFNLAIDSVMHGRDLTPTD
jgi:hypothetical protein